MGLLTKSNPFFSGELGLFHNPKVVNGPSQPILLTDKDFLRVTSGSLPALGTNLGQKSIFSSDFTSPKQFTQLPCRIARTLGERVRVGDPSKVRTNQGSCSGTLSI